MNFLSNNSSKLTSKSLDILTKVSISGWEVLVHHFDTVEGVIPSCSDNHLLVFFFSTRSNFRRLISSIWLVCYYNFCKVSELLSISYKNWRESVDLRLYLHIFSKLAGLFAQTNPLTMLIIIIVFLYLWRNWIRAGWVEHLKHMLDGWVVTEVITDDLKLYVGKLCFFLHLKVTWREEP